MSSLDGATTAVFNPSTPGSLNNAINSPIALDAQGKGYVVSETGTLYKFDPTNPAGGAIWNFSVGDADAAPVIGSDGTIYIASENGVLKAINPTTGAQISEFGLGNVVEFSAPAIGRGPDGNDIIYVGTEAGRLYAIDGTNSPTPNRERFVRELGAPIRSSITIANDGTVYAGTLDGRLYTLFGDSTGLANSPWPKAQGSLDGTGVFRVQNAGTFGSACN